MSSTMPKMVDESPFIEIENSLIFDLDDGIGSANLNNLAPGMMVENESFTLSELTPNISIAVLENELTKGRRNTIIIFTRTLTELSQVLLRRCLNSQRHGFLVCSEFSESDSVPLLHLSSAGAYVISPYTLRKAWRVSLSK